MLGVVDKFLSTTLGTVQSEIQPQTEEQYMNAFTNVFTDSVNFQDVDWWGEPCGGTHELDVRVLLEVLNDEMSYGTRKGWATRMYAWVLATEQEQYDKEPAGWSCWLGGK